MNQIPTLLAVIILAGFLGTQLAVVIWLYPPTFKATKAAKKAAKEEATKKGYDKILEENKAEFDAAEKASRNWN